jgi:hypothetical protein
MRFFRAVSEQRFYSTPVCQERISSASRIVLNNTLLPLSHTRIGHGPIRSLVQPAVLVWLLLCCWIDPHISECAAFERSPLHMVTDAGGFFLGG